MKDESLIEEMRVALRDDQDRAKARRAARLDGASTPADAAPTIAPPQAPTLSSRLGRLVRRGRSSI